MRALSIKARRWPIEGAFRTATTTWIESPLFEVHLEQEGHLGRGESEPDELDFEQWRARASEVESVRDSVERGCTREELLELLPSGPARNAVDCALLELEARRLGMRAWDLFGVSMPERLPTVYTISSGTPEVMAEQAARHASLDQLKLKVAADDPLACVRAVRAAAPGARLLVDANQAWSFDLLEGVAPGLADLGVELIEQPLPAGSDAVLERYSGPVPLCADESCRDRSSLPFVRGRYGFVNIKLDKAGGVTEALLLSRAAQDQGLDIMVGCNVGTSWAMVPAMIVAAAGARFVDLDGPLLLRGDREPGLQYEGSHILRPGPEVWG